MKDIYESTLYMSLQGLRSNLGVNYIVSLKSKAPEIVWEPDVNQSTFAWDVFPVHGIDRLEDILKVKDKAFVDRPHTTVRPHYYSDYMKIAKDPMPRKDFNSFFESTYIMINKSDFNLWNKAHDILSYLQTVNIEDDDLLDGIELLMKEPKALAENIALSIANTQEQLDDLEPIFTHITEILSKGKKVADKGIRDVLLDVLCGMYYDSGSNDLEVENKIVYSLFESRNLSADPKHNGVVIIEPSLLFIKKWLGNTYIKETKKISIIVLKSSKLVSILKHYVDSRNGNVGFVSLDSLGSYVLPKDICVESSLMFATHFQNSQKVRGVLNSIKEAFSPDYYFILGTDAWLTKKDSEFTSFFDDNDLNVSKISLFSDRIPNSTSPKRKMLLECGNKTDASQETLVTYFSLDTISFKDCFAINRLPFEVTVVLNDLLKDDSPSIREIYKTAQYNYLIKDSKRKRLPRKSINFTDEIVLQYTEQNDHNYPDRKELYIYVPKPELIDNDVVIGDDSITKFHKSNIEKESIRDYLVKDFPFQVSSRKKVDFRNEIANVYRDVYKGKPLSIRTYVYIHPELEDIFGSKELQLFKEMVFETEIGSLNITDLNKEKVQDIFNAIFENGSSSKRLAYAEFVEYILQSAADNNHIHESSVIEEIDDQSDKYYDTSDTRNAFALRSFSLDENRLLYNTSLKNFRKGKRDYLGLVISQVVGLDFSYVCALKVRDFLILEDYEDRGKQIYQLCINAFMDYRGKQVEDLTNSYQYRYIPLPQELSELIIEEIENKKSVHPDYSKASINDLFLVEGDDLTDKGERCISPKTLASLCRTELNKVGIDGQIIKIPDKNRSFSDLTISKYNNKIYRHNYRHYGIEKALFTEGEINYLIGLNPPNTYSNNYGDNDENSSQFELYQKQKRFFNLIFRDREIVHYKSAGQIRHYVSSDLSNSKTLLVLEVESSSDEPVTIDISTEHGVSISAGPQRRK